MGGAASLNLVARAVGQSVGAGGDAVAALLGLTPPLPLLIIGRTWFGDRDGTGWGC